MRKKFPTLNDADIDLQNCYRDSFTIFVTPFSGGKKNILGQAEILSKGLNRKWSIQFHLNPRNEMLFSKILTVTQAIYPLFEVVDYDI